MSKTEKIKFTVISELNVNYEPITQTQTHGGLKWALELSDNLTEDMYFTNPGELNKNGVLAVTKVLCNALVANIHYAHQIKVLDSAEHFRDAIKEME